MRAVFTILMPDKTKLLPFFCFSFLNLFPVFLHGRVIHAATNDYGARWVDRFFRLPGRPG